MHEPVECRGLVLAVLRRDAVMCDPEIDLIEAVA